MRNCLNSQFSASALGFFALISSISLVAHAEESAPSEKGAAESSTPKASSGANQTETAPISNQIPASTQTPAASKTTSAAAPSSSQAPEKGDWVFQLRGGLGGGKIANEKNVKSDRLGVGVYSGKEFGDFEISLPFLDIRDTSLGFSYQTFTGVDSLADKSWAVQSVGAGARVNASPFSNKLFDLALQGGFHVQRMVAQEPVRGTETAKYGVGISAGGFARVLAIDGVHFLAGADLVVGSASWFALSAGLESNF